MNEEHLSELAIVAVSHRPLLIALCETRRGPDYRPPRLSGYRWFGFDLVAGSGGVGLFVADHLSSSACPHLSSKHPQSPPAPPAPAVAHRPPSSSVAQAVFCRVVIPAIGCEVVVGSLYCPPKDHSQWYLLADLIRAAAADALSTNTPLLLLGDLNARHSITGDRIMPTSNPSSSSSTRLPTSDSFRGKKMVELLTLLDLHLLNPNLCYGQPTFPSSGSILDVAIRLLSGAGTSSSF